jgi:hypothetical protein
MTNIHISKSKEKMLVPGVVLASESLSLKKSLKIKL